MASPAPARLARGLLAGASLALLSAAPSGCFRATARTSRAPVSRHAEEHWEWHHYFVNGLLNSDERDTRTDCPGGVARIRTGGNVGTTLVSIVTFGLYTPRTSYVTCAERPHRRSPRGGRR